MKIALGIKIPEKQSTSRHNAPFEAEVECSVLAGSVEATTGDVTELSSCQT